MKENQVNFKEIVWNIWNCLECLKSNEIVWNWRYLKGIDWNWLKLKGIERICFENRKNLFGIEVNWKKCMDLKVFERNWLKMFENERNCFEKIWN